MPYQQETNCPTCGSPMKYVRAGVSQRTGQPYNAFWACPNKCPKANTGGFSGQVARTARAVEPMERVMATKNDYIEKAQARKDEGMRILNAKNVAGDLTNTLLEKGFIKPEQIEATFAKYCTYVYEFEPVDKQEPGYNDEFTVENVPFD